MKKPEIILIGGGGHCKACIDVVELEGRFDIAGIIDVQDKVGQKILGYSIIGTDEDLEKLSNKYDHFIVTLGQIKSAAIRIGLFERLKRLGKTLPTIISPESYVSKHALVGEGTIIMHKAVVNADANIGDHCIVNTKALIEHDALIGSYCHISTNAVVNGNCVINNSTFIGSNSTINHGVIVGEKVVIGSGAIVLKNVESNSVYLGNPPKKK
jgi:sugar O-acyltransferase (sialic acid O-acetyltransferase NeuD family)